jgi:hypothetical protein
MGAGHRSNVLLTGVIEPLDYDLRMSTATPQIILRGVGRAGVDP